MMTREEAEKELIAMLEEAEGGPSYSMEEADAYMRELLHPKNQIYLTGDTHGQFERIISFCERQQVLPESTFIILGDVGLNYYTARSEYVLYRWNDVFNNAEKIRSMVDRLRFQVECFNEALPYEAGQSYGDRAASQVRVIYRIS